LMVAGTAAVGALGQAASPRLARYYAAGYVDAFCSLLLKLLGLGAVGGLLGIALAAVAGQQIVALLFTADYAGNPSVLLLLAAAAGIGFMASFLGYAMTAARAFRIQAPLFGGVVILGVVACAVLIPRYGLVGAAVATLLSASCQFGGSAFVLRRCLQRGGGAL
ncbi:MAG: lipopolysaccharide biosynthesis protein, partial [Dehalococcoidia bacterium]